ncbi:C40 family peptidase [Euzebya rosea]|uniref:C40 family peptidase n=1 Tax=Euzebya rosea TaxID=2052804 RepID=UPI00196AEA9A|nr:NlpC/P60 family protein [Euzebya rosea]
MSLDQLFLDGDRVTGSLREALAGGTVETLESMERAGTARFALLDNDRTFLASPAATQRSIVTLAGRRYDLVRLVGAATSAVLNVEWEDVIVAALRDRTGALTAAAGTTTRGEFAARLAEEAGVACEFEPGEEPHGGQIGRGIADPNETSWDALVRLARDVRRRCFSDGQTLLFGSDGWLRSRRTPIVVREGVDGISRFGFTIDHGMPAAAASFHTTEPWVGLVGDPVDIPAGVGLVAGEWLTATVTRNHVTGVTNVDLTRPQEPLPEPDHEAVTAFGFDGTVHVSGGGSGLLTPDFVSVALSQTGTAYVFGAEAAPSNPSPRAFDCSELVEWALARVGVRFVDGSYNQYLACARAGREISVADAVRTYGALLFRTPGQPGHVAISLGNGQTIEARGRRYGVGSWSATAGRSWTHGGLVPGVAYR